MNSAAGQFIDANVLMYSMGGPHPLRSPCKEILRKIKEGRVKAVTNTEALQEILYRFFSIKKYSLAEVVYTSMVEFCEKVLPVTLKDTDLALELLKKSPGITSRDAIHAATMINNGIKDIYSTDSHFDLIAGIRRLQPG